MKFWLCMKSRGCRKLERHTLTSSAQSRISHGNGTEWLGFTSSWLNRRHYIGSAAIWKRVSHRHLRGHTATTKRSARARNCARRDENTDEARELERIPEMKKNPQLAIIIYRRQTASTAFGVGRSRFSPAFCSVPVGLCAIERWTLRCGVRASGILVTSCITRISWIAFSRAEIPIG